jgi:hypothetical protein
MTQCPARHEHLDAQHYCIKDINHQPPHECQYGHTWGGVRVIPTEPVLPYPESGGGATQGWSGSDTSQERAERERDTGTVALRQRQARLSLAAANIRGLTYRELGAEHGWHHGQSSSVLSVLHKEGRIARLVEQRDRCHVYVLNEYVGDRDTQPHGGGRTAREAPGALAVAERKLAAIRAMAEEYALLDPGDVLEVLDRQEE